MIRHRFGFGQFSFDLETDWEHLSHFWRHYTSRFLLNSEPLIRYRVLVAPEPLFERIGAGRRILDKPEDLFPVLEGAFLSDCVRLLARHFPVYHAASVAFNGVADVYLGAPNAGKSTLCAKLAKSGGVYLSDEIVCLSGGDVIAFPRPIAFNDIENTPESLPWGEEAFVAFDYGFTDRDGLKRRAFFFMPKNAAIAGSRFRLGKVHLLERENAGAPRKIELHNAERRARLALGRLRLSAPQVRRTSLDDAMIMVGKGA